MSRILLPAAFTAMLVLCGGSTAQDTKKDIKKDDPPPKAKGFLPPNWGKLGLTDSQKQDVYTIQGKYNTEIDKLDAKIKELKAARDRDVKAVLTPEQKKRLEEILLGRDK
jgi:Spy/CpxP family protein refolding chaperone